MGIIQNARDVLVLMVFFGFTIFIHEFGHFIAALRSGMIVDVFSIGFGPAIWQKKVKNIVYKICWVPLGGYVALPQIDPAGMEIVQEAEQGEKTSDQEAETAGRNLPDISVGRKLIVALAGSAGNLILGIVLAWIIYLSPAAITGNDGPLRVSVDATSEAFAAGLRSGDEILSVNGKKVNTWYDFSVECFFRSDKSSKINLSVKSGGENRDLTFTTVKDQASGVVSVPGLGEYEPQCRFNWITPGSSADKAGLKAGDTVVEFNGIKIATWTQFVELVSVQTDKATPITVKRNSELVKLSVTPAYNTDYGRTMIGVRQAERTPVWMQYRKPMDQIKSDAAMITRFLKALVTPSESKRAAKGVGGPVAIALTLWISIKSSLLNTLGFLRLLNINLAIVNLLPIPLLDGGHIVFCLWEGITRKKINPKVVRGLIRVFGTLLIGLFIIITLNDIIRIPRLMGFGKKRPAVENTTGAESKSETSGMKGK